MIDENWQDFVDNMDFVGAKIYVADEDGIVEYKSVRVDVIQARETASKALGYLDNTMDYESERLDEAYQLISEAFNILKEFE